MGRNGEGGGDFLGHKAGRCPGVTPPLVRGASTFIQFRLTVVLEGKHTAGNGGWRPRAAQRPQSSGSLRLRMVVTGDWPWGWKSTCVFPEGWKWAGMSFLSGISGRQPEITGLCSVCTEGNRSFPLTWSWTPHAGVGIQA